MPYAWTDYLELVDWTGRALRADKKGAIPAPLPPILARLGIDGRHYLKHMRRRENGFHYMIGRLASIKAAARAIGARFFKSQSYAAKLFPAPG